MAFRLAILAAAIVGAGAAWLYAELGSVRLPKSVLVQVPRGATAQDAANLLERSGVIRNRVAFLVYARLTGQSAAVRAGRYRFSGELDSREALRRLVLGETGLEEVRVTIPEGFTIRQIAARLKGAGAIRDESAFRHLCKSPPSTLIANLGSSPGGLEGYLFPDTYVLERGASDRSVAVAMLNTLAERFASPYAEEFRRNKLSLLKVVTIASLVEREAKIDEDRARIAGVIANRLRRGMKLEIDATVLYALGEHKSRVLFRDLEVESPYNSYRVKGLPPGPIASPGLKSLLAALRPEKHAFLYYVARSDGSHVFSRNKAEHDMAVRNVRAAARAESDGGRAG
jgi:UPF0755 protein